MTVHDIELKPQAWNLGPTIGSQGYEFPELCEFEIKIDSMQNDGIVSWINRQVY